MIVDYYDEYGKRYIAWIDYETYQIMMQAQLNVYEKEKIRQLALNSCWRE